MAIDDKMDKMKSKLNYIAYFIIQGFEETGMDKAYVYDKLEELSSHKNKYESLDWACRCLDSTHLPLLAKKMNFTIEEMRVIKIIFKRI